MMRCMPLFGMIVMAMILILASEAWGEKPVARFPCVKEDQQTVSMPVCGKPEAELTFKREPEAKIFCDHYTATGYTCSFKPEDWKKHCASLAVGDICTCFRRDVVPGIYSLGAGGHPACE